MGAVSLTENLPTATVSSLARMGLHTEMQLLSSLALSGMWCLPVVMGEHELHNHLPWVVWGLVGGRIKGPGACLEELCVVHCALSPS